MTTRRITRRRLLQIGAMSALWPAAAVAQGGGARRVGVLVCTPPGDPAGAAYVDACREGLAIAGWIDGTNAVLDVRYTSGLRELTQTFATEIMAAAPDIVVCGLSVCAEEIARLGGGIPIVFVGVVDPARVDLVETIARPGGNATGFTSFDAPIGGKWLSLLVEVVPSIRRVTYVYHPDPRTSPYLYYPFMEDAARSLGIAVRTAHLRSPSDIDSVVGTAATSGEGGLVLGFDGFVLSNREQIVDAAMTYGIPAIHPFAECVEDGGLLGYAIDLVGQFRSAGSIAGRILNGAAPADIPVQNPATFAFLVNLRAAQAVGVTVPLSVLTRADRILE